MSYPQYLIIQAGGVGERLGQYTENKPKLLIPVNGKPLLIHFLESFKNQKIIIVGDYKFEVLQRYINCFLEDKKIILIKAKGKGTCAGIFDALKHIPNQKPFMITWSDLLFQKKPAFKLKKQILVGLSNTFNCRLSWNNGKIFPSPSNTCGVAGFFVFPNKELLNDIPSEGAFVADWLIKKNTSSFFVSSYEIGTTETLIKFQKNRATSRFFNNVQITKKTVTKIPVLKTYSHLIDKELNWHEQLSTFNHNGFNVPKIISKHPFKMDRIQGKHPFKGSWTLPEKKIILQNIVNSLKTLHGLNKQPSSNQDIKTVYLDKTIERVNKVKQLIPFFNNASLKINGNLYTNPFWASTNYLEDYIKEIKINHFCPIHGDCTFSNILIDKDLTPWFIDPRGYFAKTSFYGDEQYDWAKLYYSLVGNYDSINNKAYTLNITSHGVSYSIKDNGWSILENYFFDISEQNKNNIQLLHALIWFALCGYVVEDYDAILISFYNGVILWNQYVESL